MIHDMFDFLDYMDGFAQMSLDELVQDFKGAYRLYDTVFDFCESADDSEFALLVSIAIRYSGVENKATRSGDESF